MKRSWKIALALAGALVIALVAGGAALASGRMHEGFMKRRVVRHIDAALDAVQATPAQRDAVHAAADQAFATMATAHQAEKGDLGTALSLWESDRIDPARVAELRAHHLAAAQQTGAAVVQALRDAHDALTAPERAQLADWLRAHKPPRLDGARPLFRHMVSERVDDLLDEVHATAEQRDKVHAAVERAMTAAGQAMADHGADLDQAIAVFTADRIDGAKVAALQAGHQARMQRMGDALVQAFTEIHDTLDVGQRKQVADFVRAHHHHHGG